VTGRDTTWMNIVTIVLPKTTVVLCYFHVVDTSKLNV